MGRQGCNDDLLNSLTSPGVCWTEESISISVASMMLKFVTAGGRIVSRDISKKMDEGGTTDIYTPRSAQDLRIYEGA